MSTTLRITEQTKARFDNAQRILSYRQKRSLTQDEVLDVVLNFWEDKALAKEMEV